MVVALAVLLEEYHIFLSLILLFNIIFIFRLGITAIRSIVFPFSFWMISDGFTGSSSLRYATDFAMLLEKCYVILRQNHVKPLALGKAAKPAESQEPEA